MRSIDKNSLRMARKFNGCVPKRQTGLAVNQVVLTFGGSSPSAPILMSDPRGFGRRSSSIGRAGLL